MKRLMIAAALAFAVHAVLFIVKMPWTPTKLLMPQTRAVTMDLVTFKQPDPTPPPVVPKPAPKPKPKPKPKIKKPKPVEPPKPEKVVMPQPTVAPDPMPEPVQEEENTGPKVLPEEAPQQAATADFPAKEEAAEIIASVPRYDINPPPVYPRLAKRRKYEGLVMLDVRVTEEGRVAEVKINQSSGHAILDRRAATTVQKWLFTPARLGPRPMEVWVQVPVRFELK